MNTLHILIGIPGCGKSTYARKLAETTGGRIVSSDGIRKELTGTEEYLYPELNRRVFEIFHSRIADWIKESDVIADATNIHVKDWRNAIALCPEGTPRKVYWFDIRPDVAMRRMDSRERKVPRDVVERMWKTMEDNRRNLKYYFNEDDITVIGEDERI